MIISNNNNIKYFDKNENILNTFYNFIIDDKCSSKNCAFQDSNSELSLSSQAFCRLVNSRPGHSFYVVQFVHALTL